MSKTRTLRLQTVRIASMALAVALFAMAPVSAQAQSLFSPARYVNETVISNYDVSQRARFLEVLNSAGANARSEALELLTDEAVQRQQARRMGLRINSDELAEGMAEFASRADLGTEEFVAELQRGGVDRATFEAFVTAGLLWRKVVSALYGPQVVVSEAEIDRALDVSSIRGSQRVLLSELFLPDDPQFAEPVAQISAEVEAVRNETEFAALAREFSIAGSRDQGGRLDWLPVENLPSAVRTAVSEVAPGRVIGPIGVQGAIVYFLLRATDSVRDIPADRVKLTYERLLLPGGRSDATLARLGEIRARVATCNDIDSFARDLPESALSERALMLAEVPSGDALELARLDRGEISANQVEGGNLVVLMLCSRELEFDEAPDRIDIRFQILNRNLSGRAELKLQELRADAEIRTP